MSGNSMNGNTPTVTVSATTSSGVSLLQQGATDCIIYNSGSTVIYFKFGIDNTVIATSSTGFVPPGYAFSFGKDPSMNYVAIISPGGAATIYIMAGVGN